MITVDLAVDEYLHLIVRTRPWTKNREEQLLDGWSEWLHDHSVSPPVLGPDALPLAREYAEARGMLEEDRREFFDAVTHLCLWAAGQGLFPAAEFHPGGLGVHPNAPLDAGCVQPDEGPDPGRGPKSQR